ncbi:SLC13 family permease [Wohlfahrtiimonas chitiniclastica]|uniref:SLC13 family permease n=1 Tax=Wohlfahrtiimonas chitiniclastica TaxID=400946 RepID=UPI001BCCECA4|nr:SLC13 family permease [Wohlfahrtiimonas chitiniclastica]MBS7816794.1 anion permease [Wohlfahrtiimonas chitiniclastica]MBS7822313.1 anion permease [Wohlfahrtiimonas chitiniclastica]MBS7830375.1 anion permease [Wohlfahrtiimonas chitiniclastica]MBS7832343.1 anion permease [Wohlfahrtiimonas chitiniclastica]
MLNYLPVQLIPYLTNDQLAALTVLILAFLAFLSGRIRYDFVALGALLALVILGIVQIPDAFKGFSHPAVISVASVLVLSHAIGKTGITYHLSKRLSYFSSSPSMLILTLAGLVAFFSAFMNDVGALALIMPIAIQLCQRYDISPAKVLMPMAFASLLGGTITVIGTPPNLIVSNYRESIGLKAFSMFDFAPTGIVITIVGLIYLAAFGWRLIPNRRSESAHNKFTTDNYLLEAKVEQGNKIADQTVADLEEISENTVKVVVIIRGARRIIAPSQEELIRANDTLLLEGQPEELKQLELLTGLNLTRSSANKNIPHDKLEVLEVVINPGSRMADHTLSDLQFREKYGLNVIGVARQGENIRKRFSRITLKVGDVLLVQGHADELPDTLRYLGCFPLAERDISLKASYRLMPTLLIFTASIILVATQTLPPQISFPLAVFLLVIFKLLPIRDVYRSQEGPLIMLLGCFITVGAALQQTGATEILAAKLVGLIGDLPDIFILGAILVITLAMTDIINNSAAAMIMCPIAYGVSQQLGHNPDAYLMGIAIASSCTFNTPIGHHSNTLVMGPAGYQFGDYWRVGLILDILILITVTPTLLWVWPLS